MPIIDSSDAMLFLSLSVDSQREFNSRPGTGYVPVEFWKKTGMSVCLGVTCTH